MQSFTNVDLNWKFYFQILLERVLILDLEIFLSKSPKKLFYQLDETRLKQGYC